MATSFTRSNLNKTSELILDFVKNYINQNSYPPSVRDICQGAGIKSTSTVHSHLKRLEEQGQLEYKSGKRRAICVPDEPAEAVALHRSAAVWLPLIGTVTAGVPILATQQIEKYVPFAEDSFSDPEHLFMLRVRGDSMKDAAILEDDLVIVRQQQQVDYGSIIVALIEDEATVKRLIRHNGQPFLKPENPAYQLIPFGTENCRILGKVVGVFREY